MTRAAHFRPFPRQRWASGHRAAASPRQRLFGALGLALALLLGLTALPAPVQASLCYDRAFVEVYVCVTIQGVRECWYEPRQVCVGGLPQGWAGCQQTPEGCEMVFYHCRIVTV